MRRAFFGKSENCCVRDVPAVPSGGDREPWPGCVHQLLGFPSVVSGANQVSLAAMTRQEPYPRFLSVPQAICWWRREGHSREGCWRPIDT